MSEKSIKRNQLFLEFISVVFAVLLALFLNGWMESYKTKKALQKVKETIRQEAVNNDSLLRKSYTYREKLLSDIYRNRHLIMKAPVDDLSIDTDNDKALESFFKGVTSSYTEVVKVIRDGERRSLILGDQVFDIVIENDSLSLFGLADIQLKTADINNRSWEIAQATGVLVEMDIALVEQLSEINMLINRYYETSSKGLDMIYDGSMDGIVPVLEDMLNAEKEILKQDSILLNQFLSN